MADYDRFRHGGVLYPLTASTTNPLLDDADPALRAALDYLAAMLHYYVGERLIAQAQKEGFNFDNAVKQKLHAEPAPFLYADQLVFPTLAIYRKSEAYAEKTLRWDHDTCELELAFILPPLTPRQVEELNPILRAAAQVLRVVTKQGFHPSYQSGALIWKNAGLEEARFVSAKYGGYEPIDVNANYYRALVGTLVLIERDQPELSGFETFDGANVGVDEATGDPITVVESETHQAPTVTSIAPNSGTKQGGTTVTVTGTGFKTNTPTKIAINGVQCTNVEVLSATQVRGVTGAFDAQPTFIADVVVTNFDGQSGRKPGAFTYTSP